MPYNRDMAAPRLWTKLRERISIFGIPAAVLTTIILSLTVRATGGSPVLWQGFLLLGIVLGSFELFYDTGVSLKKGRFALDYIAILAVILSVTTGQYMVGAIIALMLASGQTLEAYGRTSARHALTSLTNRLPHAVIVIKDGKETDPVPIETIDVGQTIVVRKGEVIPLDGILESPDGLTDESSLTGEPYMMEKLHGDHIRSGTINVGNPIIISVTKRDKESTYHKIIEMVKAAQDEKAPLVRLADRYSTIFTGITFFLAGWAFFLSHDIHRVLAVLVIATPCPLILATPIALMGGMNAAAHRRIIVKRLSALEVLSRIKAIIFDKTGTITLGKPQVTDITLENHRYSEHRVLAIASAIERNSLHPLAKAIVDEAKKKHVAVHGARDVEEEIGRGISGTVDDIRYTLKKHTGKHGMAIDLRHADHTIATFVFEDVIKHDATSIFHHLQKQKIDAFIYTGDKEEATARVVKELNLNITVKSNCSPEDKKHGIEHLHRQKKTVAMVGDGLNDAPALAASDVGLVFSNLEQTASTEAADIVFLSGSMRSVLECMAISKRTIQIALQSITVGIGLSIVGMVFASYGAVPPVIGAVLQELIDVTVIINALRASRYNPRI